MAWHMADRADRPETAVEAHDKISSKLSEANGASWIGISDPFQHLTVNGETDVYLEETVRFLERHGVNVRVRTPAQHTQMAELRGTTLCRCFFVAEARLVREGITGALRQLLTGSVFANALVPHGGAMPDHARVGATPSTLPDPGQMSNCMTQGPGRYHHRVQKAVLQKNNASTTHGWIPRTMKGQTSAP